MANFYYTNDSTGVTCGSRLSQVYGLTNYMDTAYHKIYISQNVRPVSATFSPGKAYGPGSLPSPSTPQGQFYGRYVIWNDAGGVIAYTGIVYNNTDYGTTGWPSGNVRGNTTAWFTSQPKIYAGWYKIGFIRANPNGSYGASIGGHSGDDGQMWRATNNARSVAAVDAGAWNIAGTEYDSSWYDGSGRRVSMYFSLEFRKADGGVYRLTNGSWTEVPPMKLENGSWTERTSQRLTNGSWVDSL